LTARKSLYLLLVFYGGFCSMGLEMTAARVLAPYFGTSNYIWTNVIGIILLALALGYFLGGRIADRHPRARVLGACLLAGGLLGMPIPFAIRPLAEWLLPSGLALENAFLVIFKGSFLGALLFAPSIVFMGMVSPFVIRLLSADEAHLGESSGTVFAVSTVGSLAGIFAATLWLVPALGSRMTVLLFSGLLAALALAILFWPSPRAAVGLLAFAPMLAVPALPIKATEGQLGEWESSYQYIEVTEVDGTRTLRLNEGLDSFHSVLVEGEYLTNGAYYDYYNAFPFLFEGGPSLDVAILGGGGGTGARQIRHFFADAGRFDEVRIDAVEIDPDVTRVGREYFDYPTDGVRVLDLDARVFANLARGDYDLITVDAYASQVYIPFQVATVEFFERLRALLGERGVVAMNVGSFGPDTPLAETLVATVASVFPDTRVLLMPRSRNLLVFALHGIDSLEPILDRARGTELERIAASVVLGGRPARELFPELDERELLVDAHAPVEALTDRMLFGRAREVSR